MAIQQEIEKLKKHQFAPIYVVVGTQSYLKQQFITTLVQELIPEEEQELNTIRFNMNEVPVQAALLEANSLPFFGDHRLIFVEEATFLTGEKAKLNHDIDLLEHYITNPLETTVLVFVVPQEKLDNRKKIVKLLKQQAVMIDVNNVSEKELQQLVIEYVKKQGVTIDTDALQVLLNRTNFQLSLTMKEVEKLVLFAYEHKHISLALVEDLVARSLEENIFELSQAVLEKQALRVIQICRDLVLQKEDPIKMNAILLGQFRLLVQVAYLLQQGYQEPDMQQVLQIHPFRIKLAIRQVRNYRVEALESIYQLLVQTEYELKTGVGVKQVQFEMRLLQLIQ